MQKIYPNNSICFNLLSFPMTFRYGCLFMFINQTRNLFLLSSVDKGKATDVIYLTNPSL